MVEAPAPPSPQPVAPVKMKKAPVAAAPMPEVSLPPQTPHETFRAAMSAWQLMAQQDRQARASHYDAVVGRMFA